MCGLQKKGVGERSLHCRVLGFGSGVGPSAKVYFVVCWSRISASVNFSVSQK